MTRHIAAIGLIAVLMTSFLPAYTSGGTMQAAQAQEANSIRIDAAGATFAFPLMDLWRDKYDDIYPHIALNYQSIGSGGGVQNHIKKTINFAASDVPLRDSEYEHAPGSITIPVMIGAIAIAYNLPGIDRLNLSEEALCGIYLGEITEWDDPKIATHNPETDLPDTPIHAGARSDGSGTTFAFTSYLAKTCPEWDEKIGAGKSVPWPTARGTPGNEGVAALVKSEEGTIGYITLAYAFQEDMTTAAIQNGDKTNFVRPTLESASAASSGAAPTLPDAHESWRGVDLLAAPGENSYPITSFSYLILHPDLDDSVRDLNHAKEVANLIAWIVTDGQQYNADLLYVPISEPIQNIGLEGLAKITYSGEPIYTGPTSVSTGGESQPQGVDADIIPDWVKTIFIFYAEGNITDKDLIGALQYLIQQGVIKVE